MSRIGLTYVCGVGVGGVEWRRVESMECGVRKRERERERESEGGRERGRKRE